jgi:hypothetical protein
MLGTKGLWAPREGSLSCHTCCDTWPSFFQSHPKDHPIHSPPTSYKGMLRIWPRYRRVISLEIQVGITSQINKWANTDPRKHQRWDQVSIPCRPVAPAVSPVPLSWMRSYPLSKSVCQVRSKYWNEKCQNIFLRRSSRVYILQFIYLH